MQCSMRLVTENDTFISDKPYCIALPVAGSIKLRAHFACAPLFPPRNLMPHYFVGTQEQVEPFPKRLHNGWPVQPLLLQSNPDTPPLLTQSLVEL